MNTFTRFVRRLLPVVQSQRERDDAYLAESVDIYDLERRMREIDQRGRSLACCPPALGLYVP